MDIDEIKAEIFIGFMTLEEHIGEKIPLFEKIRITINKHFAAKAPLLEKVEPTRLELIESTRKGKDPYPLKLMALFFFQMASNDDLNRFFEVISRMLTLQGCIMLFQYYETADRHISRDVLREEMIARVESMRRERKKIRKRVLQQVSFPIRHR